MIAAVAQMVTLKITSKVTEPTIWISWGCLWGLDVDEMGSVGVFWVALSDITSVWECVCVCVCVCGGGVVEGWVTQQRW